MRKTVSPRLLLRRSGSGLLALVIMVSLLSAMTTNVFAGSVNVYDFANVLNKSQINSEASSLPYAMDIYTTNTFNGSQPQFASETDGKINQNNKVVMAIDVRNHYVYLDGRGVSLSRSQYQDAANAFSSSYRSNHDYSGAAVAAIDSLRGNSNSGNAGVSGYAPGGNSFGLGALCCIGLLVLAGLAVFGIVRSRRGVGRGFNRGPVASPYNQYNQGAYPPNYQGPYPPNYGPGYPNYNQGMNPLAAGGLGAAAGGFLGYELGKEQGERQGREEDGFNQGGNYGGDGGAGSNFGGDNNGGGAGADFGGGNNGGGDWGGGGAGADFGGGNNGGGSDFGGGGGDNGGGAGSNF